MKKLYWVLIILGAVGLIALGIFIRLRLVQAVGWWGWFV